MSDNAFLNEFKSKFDEFREIEASIVVGKFKDNACTKAFALLRDMELCYASGAYYACLIIACASIEACLNHEFGDGGFLKAKLEQSGYAPEADWLRETRNKIVHQNDHSVVKFHLLEEDEEELKDLCRRAFALVHTIYYHPSKQSSSA
ncbi:hypothetical protein [Pseudomonas sp. BN102]|uniref:hypothetical protein n=1 Tax=Pseudomonas sp. BN102 TaxID=2567886 RepID=UPI002454B46B|nr:hypothetical protein [Pseudomonas sp. BN102]MDH4610469.1 hypothetical protein [Pseudomonas sp. BN102]